MNIFTFIIFLGIINIVFGFIWRWIFAYPITILLAILNLYKAKLLVKAFSAYLIISLTALETLFALQNVSEGWKLFFFPLIGAFILFMGFLNDYYAQRDQVCEQVRMSNDYSIISEFEKQS